MSEYDALEFYRKTYGDLSPYATKAALAKRKPQLPKRNADTHAKKSIKDHVKQKILRFQIVDCYLCCKHKDDKLTIEHVKPRKHKGQNRGNRLVAHYLCNKEKGSRLPYPCEILFLDFVYQQMSNQRN